jgi:hypothetical protein
MRIDGTRPVQPNAGGKRTERAAGGFSVSGASQPTRTAASSATSAAVGVEGLLALQSEDSPMERRRRAVNKGRQALDALDFLKISMLEGQSGAGAAQRLANAAQQQELTGDLGLDDTLQQISVRAAVELAKLRLRG